MDRGVYKDTKIREFNARMHLQGGGERTPRLTSEAIRAAVMERSAGICCHCGQLIRLEKQRQIAHIRRNDDDGAFLLDNLCVAHDDCDKAVDSGNVVYTKDGSAIFCDPRFTTFTPDASQLSRVSPANLVARWNWAKAFWESSALSDADFEIHLVHDLGFIKKG